MRGASIAPVGHAGNKQNENFSSKPLGCRSEMVAGDLRYLAANRDILRQKEVPVHELCIRIHHLE